MRFASVSAVMIGMLCLCIAENSTAQQREPKLLTQQYHDIEAAEVSALQSQVEHHFFKLRKVLSKRDFDSSYAMFRLSFQAQNPRLEWEMKLRARDQLWADSEVEISRISWFLNPTDQPAGLYASLDFRGQRPDGSLDCGYVVLHRPTEQSEFSFVRTDVSYVPSHLMDKDLPTAEVLEQLPCYLGESVVTSI